MFKRFIVVLMVLTILSGLLFWSTMNSYEKYSVKTDQAYTECSNASRTQGSKWTCDSVEVEIFQARMDSFRKQSQITFNITACLILLMGACFVGRWVVGGRN